MAKIKVHELAKQIGADRKAVVDYLHTKGYDTMTAVSAVPDNEVDNIRSSFWRIITSCFGGWSGSCCSIRNK